MIFHVFKKNHGKGRVSRTYYGKYQCDGMPRVITLNLGVTEKRIAEKKLQKLFDEAQNETNGSSSAKSFKEAAKLPIIEHLEQFIKGKTALGRTATHLRTIRNAIIRVCNECGWQYLDHINASDFENWRADQTIAPKTLNEYLSALNAFTKWLYKRRKIKENPLLDIERVDTRGKQKRLRRALSLAEALRLLNIASPKNKVAYLLALTCGFRRHEIEQLKWSDLHLDTEIPFIAIRAEIAKNRKDDIAVLKPETLKAIQELKALRPDTEYITGNLTRMCYMRKDWKKANIEYIDKNGYIADFHSLRKTFCTFLQKAGVAPRIVQEAMRHSDPKLTSQTYTDAKQFNMSQAISQIPDLEISNLDASKNEKSGALIGALARDFEGQNLSFTVTNENIKKRPKTEVLRRNIQKKTGASCRSRTDDLLITSQLLYQLS